MKLKNGLKIMFLLIWNAQVKKDFLPLFSVLPLSTSNEQVMLSATLNVLHFKKKLFQIVVCTTTLVHKVEYQFNRELLSIEKRLTKADLE